MTKYRLFYLLPFLLVSFSNLVAQDSFRSWSIGLNSSSILYSKKDGSAVGGRYIAIIPGVSLSKYIGNKMTVSFGLSKSIRDSQKYVTGDANLNYELLNPDYKLRIYVLGGMSIVNLLETGITLNLGGGGTLWITDRFGLNGQLMYKLNASGGDFQRSHIFGTAGIVYSLHLGGSNSRIWERNH
ncbi:MAG: hypothetical protein GW772_09270 [Flavobacteriia bacterium]|nr:hypothetical protein [Flavobacteriia bacterium]OIP46273.1 MAG: hypothetical protein AUK46_08610 [Flavobacteriaceae bacterium CG2_30_31_66]PIV95947.1 MAG: hypothetical protein COW43_10825 [Flavobacteriaceae bacterium CG17_big_fil_post_rev_8_21_14_2_50_31_13]PIX13532.1 MAG: hypothetical protein COZ74_05870 [Flavobacteriaceae bacterium CG_4_8_14_3_um_filter_31_8]PIY16282.1 MAG: hypothetical protein COZ16_00535 [Flavobacteriaceae bacterium CG_4_10_14_3_um_filter_31_253]PIZ11943.1 MAG: hypotheti